MRRSILAFTLFAAACGGTGSDAAPDPDDIKAAREAAQALGQQLQSRLSETLPNEGPLAAIEVCSQDAPEIASAVSADAGLTVGRTALRVRNPENRPDAFETARLESFAAAIAAGEDAASLEHAEIVDGTFRWMKPIVMRPQCSLCHGTEVPESIASAVAARYPDDAAVGFVPGELRGAFTVEKPLR